MSGGRRADTERTVVGRALAILESFTGERPDMRLVEISRRTGLPANTVLRLVRQLCGWARWSARRTSATASVGGSARSPSCATTGS